MSTKTFTLYLYYVEKHSTPNDPHFVLSDTDGMESQGWTEVRQEKVTVDLPDMKALTSQRLAALEVMKVEMRAKYARAVKEIDDRINSLLAIENHVEAA